MSPRSLLGRLEPVVRRSRWMNIAFYLLRDLRSRFTVSLNTHRQTKGQSVDEAVAYVERTFADLSGTEKFAAGTFEGKRVLELGPGDNLGLALRFLAAGASQVVALDRFAIRRDPRFESAVYSELMRRLAPHERARCEAALDIGEAVSFDPARLEVVTGVGVEQAAATFEPSSFDMIVSVAVLEHVQDLDASFEAMDRLLGPGGVQAHAIDFRDHRMFTAGGHHPLEFLTVSPRLWRLMTAHSGGPNRHLIPYYRRKVGELGYHTTLLALVGLGADDGDLHDGERDELPVTSDQRHLVDQIRPRLRAPFREMATGDLAATVAFLTARKEAG